MLKHKKKYIAIILILLLIGLAYKQINLSTPEKTINKLVKGVNDKNFANVIKCFTNEKQKEVQGFISTAENITDISFSKSLQWIPIISHFISKPNTILHIKINNKEEDNNIAKLNVTIRVENISVECTIFLIKQKKIWLIDKITK